MKPTLRTAMIGEFLGTALLVLLIDGVVASVVLLNKQADWIVITAGCALAVTLSVYVSGRLSGGHLNPAVTLALAVRGEFPWSRLLPYWSAQMLGAFAGAALVYADYASAFTAFEATNHIVRGAMVDGKLAGPAAGGAGVFATYPAFDDLAGNLFSEFLGTARPALRHPGVDRSPQRGPPGEPRAGPDRCPRRGHRPLAGRPDGLRDQPGARLRASAGLRASSAGGCRSSARTTDTSGSRSSPPSSAASAAPRSTTWPIRRHLPPADEPSPPGELSP